MCDEPEQKRGETDPRIQSDCDQQLGDTEQPDKALSGESLAPVWFKIPRRNSRTQRRPEARNRSTISAVRFALPLPQRFFLAKDQAINKNPIGEDQENKSRTAGENADSRSHRQRRQIKRIPSVSKWTVRD